MKDHPINSAWNFIGGWYIDDNLCDLIVSDFENRKSIQKEAHSARGYKVIYNNMMNQALMDAYRLKLLMILEEYKRFYKYSHETIEAFTVADPWNIQKYEVGKHYSVWHCENNGDPKFRRRHLAFMTYLNTVEDGGETEFLYQTVRIRPEKGLTLIWPAHFTHTHIGLPSNTQEKYVTTGWFEFFDTEKFLDEQRNATDEDFWLNIDKIHRHVS